jgi:hypothetical protein
VEQVSKAVTDRLPPLRLEQGIGKRDRRHRARGHPTGRLLPLAHQAAQRSSNQGRHIVLTEEEGQSHSEQSPLDEPFQIQPQGLRAARRALAQLRQHLMNESVVLGEIRIGHTLELGIGRLDGPPSLVRHRGRISRKAGNLRLDRPPASLADEAFKPVVLAQLVQQCGRRPVGAQAVGNQIGDARGGS